MKKVLTQKEINALFAQKANLSLEEAEFFTETFSDLLREHISANEDVEIENLGVFQLLCIPESEIMNALNGAKMTIPMHSALNFIPAKSLLDAVEQGELTPEEELQAELEYIEDPKAEKNIFFRQKLTIILGIVILISIIVYSFAKLFDINYLYEIYFDKNNSIVQIDSISGSNTDSLNTKQKLTNTVLVSRTSVDTTKSRLKVPREVGISVDKAKKQTSGVTTSTAQTQYVILKEGSTLRAIALQYYGSKDFWVYVYLENKDKISNPNSIPLGTKLIIAEASKYHIDASDEASIKKARNLGASVIQNMTR